MKTTKKVTKQSKRSAPKKYVPKAGTLGQMGVKRFVAATPALDGFTRTLSDVEVNWQTHKRAPLFTLQGDGITIAVTFHDPKAEWGNDASTSFTVQGGGRRTFDRVGVESSFYVNREDTPAMFVAKLQEQIAKVAASRARAVTALQVPVLGWTVQPAEKERITALLKAGKSHSFRPSGFGTGNTISMRHRSVYDRPCPEAAQFFGVSVLYYSQYDCD